MINKKLLYGLLGVGVLYALYMKNKNKRKTYSKECYDALERALQDESVKPPNFNQIFLENCEKNKVSGLTTSSIKFSNFTPLTSDELLKINNQNGYCKNPSPSTIQGYDCFKDSKGNTWLKITKKGVITWTDSFGNSYNENGKDITSIQT